MFVETMTSQQMAEQYKKDFDQISTRLSYDVKKWWRASLRRRTFPFFFSKSGTTKQGNIFKAIVCQEKKGAGFSTRLLIRMKTSNGDAWIDGTSAMSGKKVFGIDGSLETIFHLFQPHLFRRYEERFGRMSGYENIADQFFLRNNSFISAGIEGTDRFGENEFIGVIDDGFIYGTSTIKEPFITWRTFLRQDQLNNKQMAAAQRLAKDYIENESLYRGVGEQKVIYSKI